MKHVKLFDTYVHDPLSTYTLPSGRVIDNKVTLKHIVFPSTVTWIGDRVGQYAYVCESVTLLAVTPPTLYTTNFFNNHAANFKIYVPADSVEAYKAAANWSKLASYIETIPAIE